MSELRAFCAANGLSLAEVGDGELRNDVLVFREAKRRAYAEAGIPERSARAFIEWYSEREKTA